MDFSTYFPNYHKMFPKYEGKGSFPKSQIKSLCMANSLDSHCLQRNRNVLVHKDENDEYEGWSESSRKIVAISTSFDQ